MERFITTSPHLVQMVERFLQEFPKYQTPNESEDAFHQLQGNLGLRCALNSVRICNCLVTYCQGNPYTLNTPLRKITSSVLLPEKCQERYKSLITNILFPTLTQSIWDPLSPLKLVRFSTCNKMKSVKFRDKVMKLREDRQFYSRILIITQSRPEIITGIENLVSEY